MPYKWLRSEGRRLREGEHFCFSDLQKRSEASIDSLLGLSFCAFYVVRVSPWSCLSSWSRIQPGAGSLLSVCDAWFHTLLFFFLVSLSDKRWRPALLNLFFLSFFSSNRVPLKAHLAQTVGSTATAQPRESAPGFSILCDHGITPGT
ncbi:uncharacterized protein B0I36DRAFT_116044 [Microdochium trichocladiopsis]|uniref:Uncharacterized protein n=1 Tax=Microdochium trichocladiopsis TaxID=1682393 RepID=A0A9P8Y8H6_9PEZI|nr:uncharacterized protein B0I36DRAFT_116044 [Microdochium trichocladiopsis]KAH7030921.1 hypothetical protein B0I36DRAFT_116044 [Microdochium trichocladiopsis]